MGPGDEASRKWHHLEARACFSVHSGFHRNSRTGTVRVSNVDVILRRCGIDENDRRRLDKLLISQIWPDVLLSMESFFKGEYKEK